MIGEEWLSSLPKHVQLYRSFGWPLPVFCHLPLLRNADKSKISKRKNPVSLNHYRRAGFLPEALLNFLALMGWAMPDEREEFSLDEFVAAFTLERISLGGPIFDQEKLRWLNGKYLRRMSGAELLGRLRGHLLAEDYVLSVLALVREPSTTWRTSRLRALLLRGAAHLRGPDAARLAPPAQARGAAKGLDLSAGETRPIRCWPGMRRPSRRPCALSRLRGLGGQRRVTWVVRVAATGRAAPAAVRDAGGPGQGGGAPAGAERAAWLRGSPSGAPRARRA